MRSTLFLLVFLSAQSLAAQNYTQNNPPVQQMQVAVDCYTRNLDNGNAALSRGDAQEAMRFFKEAKNCPDAQSNTRRRSEIDSRISRCEEQLGIPGSKAQSAALDAKKATSTRGRNFSTELPSTRRDYPANRLFLRDTLDDCFEKMVDEADRAFRFKFWEDAAALYRAAKNCNDADQNDRQRMSEKIVQCRKSAENELFAKQQEAERQARHAIAANLADDSQELLRTTDRSLAFRLADFANQYIAPDDNTDCVQAMFDAWYYQPNEASKHRPDELYRPVFCYEIANNLGENVQIKFKKNRNGSQSLWAFVPKVGDMFVWDIPSMKLSQTYGTGEGNNYLGFEPLPTDDILFWGKNFYELKRGTRSHRVQVPSVTNWCFSTRGDEFFYENPVQQKIYVLSVRDALTVQATRKGAKNTNFLQVPVVEREMVSGISAGLLAMQYLDGNFWLGYADRVEILSKDGPGKPWKRQTIRYEGVEIPNYVEQKDLKLKLFPKEGFATLGYSLKGWTIPIQSRPDSTAVLTSARGFENMYPLAVSPGTRQVAYEYNGNYLYYGFWLMDALTGDTLLHQRLPSFAGFDVLSGSFSSDARWVAAATRDGNISLWALKDAPTMWTNTMPYLPDDKPIFSPNGERLFIHFADTVAIINTSVSENPEHYWKNHAYTLRGASDEWAVVQISADSAEARHLNDGRRLKFPLANPESLPLLYAIDAKGEQLMAYLTDWNRVEVRSLKTGALVASKVFEGGSIGEIHFIPGTDQLLVLLHTALGESQINQSSVKIWSPLRPSERSSALRLHQYPVRSVAIDPTGSKIALSNGSDIRIFDLQNIENEALKIRISKDKTIQAIAFRANTNLLAAAYTDGNVIFWNTETGQSSLQLQAIQQNEQMETGIHTCNIGFSHDGNVLHMATTDGQMVAYALDPSYIRSEVQNENRQLQSLGVEHIVQYGLEDALYYPGNFERLAESNDAPLLRAFFQHFGEQALESNNITQVKNYCERALYLYQRLSDNTKEIWLREMIRMYEDYAWKLLLRGNIAESAKQVAFIKSEFSHEPLILSAHLALMRKDCAGASERYSRFFLTDGGYLPHSYETQWRFEQAEKELAQLQDYELLDTVQVNCFCGTVRLSGAFFSFCPKQKNYTAQSQSAPDRLRWEIYQKREEVNSTLKFEGKVSALEAARAKARSLVSLQPANTAAWEETVVYELAKTHRDWAVFEQNSVLALQHFEKSEQVLMAYGPFKGLADSARLSLLSSTHLMHGRQLLDGGHESEAVTSFNAGLEAVGKLWALVYTADSLLLPNYSDNIAGPLYEKLGTAFLLAGQSENARKSYEQAGIYFMTYGFNSLYNATVSAFEGNETEAFLDYGGIFTADQTAESLYLLGRLAQSFPEHRTRLEVFEQRLRSALISKNQRLVTAETDFWLASRKKQHFAAQARWDSSVVWSRVMLDAAERCSKLPNADPRWINSWLDEHINLAYFLLLEGWGKPASIAESIRHSEAAEAFLQTESGNNLYYINRELLKTNLAHALILRNQSGDRQRAVELYKQFLRSYASPMGYDNLDILQKDFRDLQSAGAPWPELPNLNDER